MVYEITQDCRIANKEYKKGDLVTIDEVGQYFTTVMKPVTANENVKVEKPIENVEVSEPVENAEPVENTDDVENADENVDEISENADEDKPEPKAKGKSKKK